jgi:hypothetical protein
MNNAWFTSSAQLSARAGVHSLTPTFIMKTFFTLLTVLFLAAASRADTLTLASGQPASSVTAQTAANYRILVDWHGAQGETNSLEVLTTEGQVEFDGLQKNPVKINNNEVPATLKLTATLKALNEEKGRLQLFLGRTVPYVTGSSPGGNSSYSQMNVGLESTFLVTFGKPVVIQSDANGTISVLVTRLKD